MFNNDALGQLAQLKQDIRSTKEFSQGEVRGTSKRFGFVVLDDGRDAFLNPDEMQRVFPGDRVEVSLETNDKDQLEASLEKLIDSPFMTETFVGKYLVRGKGHFVEPDLRQLSRWIFLPPKNRKDAAHDDYITAKITRHPFNAEGKASAEVIQRIGCDSDIAIEAKYITEKFKLPFQFSDAAKTQAQEIAQAPVSEATESRFDLTELDFVTIDSASTQDMDDALFAEKTDAGWKLFVAIADPSDGIALESPLGAAAQERVNTVYLPGNPITMLPSELSNNTYSLVESQVRPALICTLMINEDGQIIDSAFSLATIRSKAKLSYQQVAAWLDGESSDVESPDDENSDAITEAQGNTLRTLSEMSYARTRYRQDHALVMEDRPDYHLVLNDKRKIDRIEKHERNAANAIVEEAMLATNSAAGEFFAQHPGYGIFSAHAGFKAERVDEAKSLLKDDKPELASIDIESLEGYINLIGTLQKNNANCTILAALKRMLQPGRLTTEPEPHLGLGLKHYANVTSPIRRFNDLYNHHAIKAIITGQAFAKLTEADMPELQARVISARQSSRQMEQWLYVQYMKPFEGQEFKATITMVNSAGLGVRLEDNGAEGFIYLAGDRNNRPQFDARRLKLTHNDQNFALDQSLQVKVDSVDLEARKVNLSLIG